MASEEDYCKIISFFTHLSVFANGIRTDLAIDFKYYQPYMYICNPHAWKVEQVVLEFTLIKDISYCSYISFGV